MQASKRHNYRRYTEGQYHTESMQAAVERRPGARARRRKSRVIASQSCKGGSGPPEADKLNNRPRIARTSVYNYIQHFKCGI